MLSGLNVFAVRFKASHAKWNASAHNDAVAGNCAPGKNPGTWNRPTMATVLAKVSARSATPLNGELSAVVNSCLIPLDLYRSPNVPALNSPPPSNQTITTLERTPSAREFARNCSKISVVSDFWRIECTHVRREKSSHTMRVYCFPPKRLYHPRSTQTPPPEFFSARVGVDCLIPL